MNDAFRVCSHTIPDRSRTIACMVQNKSQLSARLPDGHGQVRAAGSTQTATRRPLPRTGRPDPHRRARVD